jgi:hypothetical protein
VRRSAIVLAAVLLALSARASAGTLSAFPEAGDPASAPDNANRPAAIISIAPAYSSEIPALVPNEGQPAAAVSPSSNGFGSRTTGAVPNGTVRALVSPPSAGSTSDN